MSKRKKDFFYQQAKNQGVVARSYFKIEDLDQKYHLIRKSNRVFDIGASPGSWVQYLQQKVGENGFIYAVDLQPLKISLPSFVVFEQRDLLAIEPEEILERFESFDVMVSDAAPRTTGQNTVDHMRSAALCEHVVSLAERVLKPRGKLIFKMYQGEQTPTLIDRMKDSFSNIRIQKPSASRKESREIFILAEKK